MSERYEKHITDVKKLIRAIYRDAKGELSDAVGEILDLFIKETDIEDDATKEQKKNNLIATFNGLKKKKLADVLDRLYELNKEARDTINDHVPEVMADSLSYECFSIEQELDEDIGLIPFDEKDCEEWLEDDPDIYHMDGLSKRKDKKWNEQNLRNMIIAGILLGLTKNKIKDYVTSNLINRNERSMIGNVFTVLSGAGEAGKESAMFQADSKGVDMVKQWIATLDFKTRDSHRELDGNEVAVDKEFSPGLRFPRDPNAPPAERCNCRCTMNKHIKGWKSKGERRENIRHYREDGTWYKPVIKDMTYKEWYQMKVDELGELEIKRQVKEMKREQQQKYYRNRKRRMKEGA